MEITLASDCLARCVAWAALGFYRLAAWLGALSAAVLMAGCAVQPQPLEAEERERLAAESYRSLFEGQEPLDGPLTLPEATARAIKYQAEYRQRQMEEALAAAQIDVAKFDMLPRLTLNAGYSSRSNVPFGFGFTPQGTIALNPSASVEPNIYSSSIGFAWNLLDFGVSYYRARQLADLSLVTQERRRKALQTLIHDVRIAWWRAEAAQRLLPAADKLLTDIDRALGKARVIEARKLLPPVQIATLRRALLDLGQQISLRRFELAQAGAELAALVNVPPGSDLRVAAPASDIRNVLDLTADVDQLESVALRSRPELAEEAYRARISKDEATKALVSLLPGLTLGIGRYYDSNAYLVNNWWTTAGWTVAFNLVRAFSIPALNRQAEAQQQVDDARRLAITMAVLTQTRLAAVRYNLAVEEFRIWDDSAREDDLIVDYMSSNVQVGLDTELELIRAKARTMASHMNRGLAYGVLQGSIARLYHSVGYDLVPQADEAKAVPELTRMVEGRLSELERANFSPRAEAERPSVAIAAIGGVGDASAALVREGTQRVLEASRVRIADTADADVQLRIQLSLEQSVEGRRAARVAVALERQGLTGPRTISAEYRTTLSAPIDEEQWRALGEGAIYRILEHLTPPPPRRPSLRVAESLQLPLEPLAREEAVARVAWDEGGPLLLRASPVMHSLPNGAPVVSTETDEKDKH